ncbi:MAG: tyrosine-type recombinase/integrase [Candidatus Kapaibacterium sp.]
MGKTRKRKGKRWDHPDHKKGAYCFERDGYIHTYVFGNRKSIKNLPWNKINKDFAIQVLDNRIREYYQRNNGFNSSKTDTFSDLFILYKEVKFQHLKLSTKQSVVNCVRMFLDNNDLDLTNTVGITSYFSSRVTYLKKIYADSTINNALTQIRTIFNFAVEAEIIDSNPIKSWMRIKGIKFKFTICTRAQLNDYLESLKSYIDVATKLESKTSAMKLYYALMIVGFTGMRRGEVCKIKEYHILNNKLSIHGKNDMWRDFPFSIKPGLKEFLFNEVIPFNNNHIKESEYLLGIENSTSLSTYIKNYREMLKIKNVEEVKFHAVRKLVENEMMNDNRLNTNIVRSLIGHSLQTQTKHYINKMSAEDIEEVIRFNKNNT